MKTLAGLGLVGLIVVGYPRQAGAGAVEVKINIDSTCKVAVAPMATKVLQSKRDVLVWSIASECPNQQVIVCPTGKDPFEECKGDPDWTNVGKVFPVYAGAAGKRSSATVSCHINWDYINGTFNFEVFNGPADTPPTCPPAGEQGPIQRRVSEIAIEVLP